MNRACRQAIWKLVICQVYLNGGFRLTTCVTSARVFSRCYIVKLCGCRAIGGSHMAPDITLYLTNWLAFDVKICSLAVLSTRYYILLKVTHVQNLNVRCDWLVTLTRVITLWGDLHQISHLKNLWLAQNSLECDTQKASHLTMWPTTNFPPLSHL